MLPELLCICLDTTESEHDMLLLSPVQLCMGPCKFLEVIRGNTEMA